MGKAGLIANLFKLATILTISGWTGRFAIVYTKIADNDARSGAGGGNFQVVLMQVFPLPPQMFQFAIVGDEIVCRPQAGGAVDLAVDDGLCLMAVDTVP